jgi:ABC-type uncharacterized transport system substrate-binding protein
LPIAKLTRNSIKQDYPLRFIIYGLLLAFTAWVSLSSTESYAGELQTAKVPKVVFVLEDQAASSQAILKGFREYSRKQAGKLVRIDLIIDNGQTQAQLRQQLAQEYDLIIPVGDKSFKAVLATHPQRPVFSIDANQSVLRAYHRQSPAITGIFSDQPFERYAALLNSLLPQYRRIGILLSQKSKSLKPIFDKVMQQYEFAPVANILLSNDLPQRVLEYLAIKCDLVIAIKDDKIYNPDNIKSHLLTAFRHKIPVIGTSANFAEVGAVAAIYTDHFKLGNQAAKYVLPVIFDKKALPPPMYPESFELVINYNVLRSFGVDSADIQQLRERLQQVPILSQ